MKARRQALILNLINEYPISTQDELQLKLKDSGFNVTQATVSRDIKELGLLKSLSSQGRYRYTSPPKNVSDVQNNISGFFNSSVISVKPAGNILVVKTLSGMAQAVCASIDNSNLEGIAGTLAGDDTIFIVCDSPELTSSLMLRLKKLL